MNQLDELLKEAFHTYKLYLECTGVLELSGAAIYLFKWPDATHSAISLINQPENKHAMLLLQHELKSLIVDPISIIHDAAIDRLAQLSGVHPIKAEKIACEAKGSKYQDPFKTKELLIQSINDVFTTINVMTNVEYPTLNKMEK